MYEMIAPQQSVSAYQQLLDSSCSPKRKAQAVCRRAKGDRRWLLVILPEMEGAFRSRARV
jgi:hypothetical protein